jgi:UPF0755 protein
MKLILRSILAVAVLGLVAVGAAVWSLTWKYAGFPDQVFVDIPRGTSTRAVGSMLAQAGVVRYDWQFLLARAIRPGERLQAGEYLFRRPASVWEVFGRIAKGDVFYYDLTVPEGHNIFDIAAAVESAGIMRAADFLDSARDPSLILDLAPKAPTLEGYLFPDTYRFTRHTGARQLCSMMTARFRRAWEGLGVAGADVHDTVTLASLVEKESGLPRERPLVASVFLNRLRINMPLQCDPTAIYAAVLEERYQGKIYRSDLLSKQRYNTYQYTGLPPGPIANPGLASLQAVLRPAETDFLYFVALPDGSGGHQFSKELTEHARAVREYRRGQNQANQAQPGGRIPEPDPDNIHR